MLTNVHGNKKGGTHFSRLEKHIGLMQLADKTGVVSSLQH